MDDIITAPPVIGELRIRGHIRKWSAPLCRGSLVNGHDVPYQWNSQTRCPSRRPRDLPRQPTLTKSSPSSIFPDLAPAPARDATVHSTPLSTRDKPCCVPACRWCHAGRNGLWEVTANVPPWFNSTGHLAASPRRLIPTRSVRNGPFAVETFLNFSIIAAFLNSISRAFAEVSTRPTL